jgi:hypothetical protein
MQKSATNKAYTLPLYYQNINRLKEINYELLLTANYLIERR